MSHVFTLATFASTFADVVPRSRAFARLRILEGCTLQEDYDCYSAGIKIAYR